MEKLTFNQLSNFLLSQMSHVILYETPVDREKLLGQLEKHEIDKEEWDKLTLSSAKALGFQLWEENNNLMLIPGYLHRFIPQGLDLYCINGEKEQYTSYKELDNDCRYGSLAYGIYLDEQNS